MVANITVRPEAELYVSMTVCPKSNLILCNICEQVQGSKSHMSSACFKMSDRIANSSLTLNELSGMKGNVPKMCFLCLSLKEEGL